MPYFYKKRNARLRQDYEKSRIKRIVNALLLHEFFMVASLYYFSAFHNHYAVGVADSRKPVCDNENRSALHKVIHTRLNNLFRTRID